MIPLEISTKKNLLAFSAGIDSSALFFLLIENNIPFDIAIVNYNMRNQSKDEVIYAKQLATKYKKQIFLKEFPKEYKFSEKNARDFRYNFFEDLILQYNYETLLTAHQLNDKLEWFLMQFSKGAGVVELMGMNEIEYRDNYCLSKPLLGYSKDELQLYLDNNNHKYFIDETNKDQKYKRNLIRHNFSNDFLDKYKDGIKSTFSYLQEDIQLILPKINKKQYAKLSIFDISKLENTQLIRIIDKELKIRGIMISSATRDEILKQKKIIISNKISISIVDNQVWIAPYITTVMDKNFKEKCRISKIPSNIRAYLFSIDFNRFDDLLY
jgi:tRNA(Ile)-lysidine synthase